MNLSLFAFKFIDYGFDFMQNYSRYKGITTVKDIVYNEECSDVCKLDLLYIPKEGKKYPVFMYIHGGGFIAGDKKHRRSFSSFVAEQGFFVVNINHGLCPDYKFPSFLSHPVKALNWIVANAEKYNLDMDNLFVGGDSSGGYISSMLGAMQSDSSLADKLGITPTPAKIKGLLLISGSYDMASLVSGPVPFKIAAEMGETITGVPKKSIYKNKAGLEGYQYYNELFPATYINEKFPASFIAHSTKDFFVPKQGENFIELLKSKNIKYAEHKAERIFDIHCYPLFRYLKTSKACLKGMQAFLTEMTAK